MCETCQGLFGCQLHMCTRIRESLLEQTVAVRVEDSSGQSGDSFHPREEAFSAEKDYRRRRRETLIP